MKKYVTLLMTIFAGVSQISAFSYQGLEFEPIPGSDSLCRLTGYDKDYLVANNGNLVIPSEAVSDNVRYTVAEIENYLFQGLEDIKSATISADVASLGNGLFRGCRNLSEVKIFGSDIIIPDYIFADCENLLTFTTTIPVKIVGKQAFNACHSLSNFDFQNIEIIGERAFSGCSSLNTLILSSRILSLPDGVFEHCTALSTFVTGRHLTSIGNSAFEGCTALTDVQLDENVEDIGARCFAGCKALDKIYSLNPVPPSAHHDTFDASNYMLTSLCVTPADRDRYVQMPVWMNFKTILATTDFPFSGVWNIERESSLHYQRSGNLLYIESNHKITIASLNGRLIYLGIPDGGIEIDLATTTLPAILSDGKQKIILR